MPILWPLKVPERGNAITQRKTLEIEHSCLFIHLNISFPSSGSHLFILNSQNYAARALPLLFNTPKKIPTQIKLPQKILAKFSYPKKSRNRKFQTQKNPSIIPVTWNPEYPPGQYSQKFTTWQETERLSLSLHKTQQHLTNWRSRRCTQFEW